MGISMRISAAVGYLLIDNYMAKVEVFQEDVYRDATPEEYESNGDQFIVTRQKFVPHLVVMGGLAMTPTVSSDGEITHWTYDGSRGSFAICKAIYDNRHSKLKECPDVRELDISFDHDTYWSPTGWTDETEPTTGWLKPVTAPSPKE